MQRSNYLYDLTDGEFIRSKHVAEERNIVACRPDARQ
jgi:hypothetical protein